MSDGFVYFIQEEGTHKIKIGFSEKHPNGRLKDFKTGNSNKLNLLGYIEGTYEDESNLHREFYEERGNGEWFEPSPRLNDRIKELLEESLEEKKSGIEDLNKENEDIVEGEWKDGKQNGHGTLTFPDGQKYLGEWKSGREHGQGKTTFPDGNEYEGRYKDGEFHGQGTFIWSKGDSYVGEFKDGKQHGHGTYTYSNGDKYVGEWKDGDKNGQGTLTSPDGSNYVGEFKDGEMWNGKQYDEDGHIISKFVNGDEKYEEEEEDWDNDNLVRISRVSDYENRFKKPESLVKKISDLFK